MKTTETEIVRLRAEVKGLRALLAQACTWDASLDQDASEEDEVIPEWRREAQDLLEIGREILKLEVVCAYANCPRLGDPFTATGKGRYCSTRCRGAARAANISMARRRARTV